MTVHIADNAHVPLSACKVELRITGAIARILLERNPYLKKFAAVEPDHQLIADLLRGGVTINGCTLVDDVEGVPV